MVKNIYFVHLLVAAIDSLLEMAEVTTRTYPEPPFADRHDARSKFTPDQSEGSVAIALVRSAERIGECGGLLNADLLVDTGPSHMIGVPGGSGTSQLANGLRTVRTKDTRYSLL